VGSWLKIIRSENGYDWEDNTPNNQCILDTGKICTFYTDRLSYFAVIKESKKQTSSGSSWGGGWSSSTTIPTCTLSDLVCVNNSYEKKNWVLCNLWYEGTICESTSVSTGSMVVWTGTWWYSEELVNAYLWALYNWITTKNTIQDAKMEGTLLRRDLAKMMSQYVTNVMKKTIPTTSDCTFSDITNDKNLYSYVNTVCQLGLMWKNTGQLFNPDAEVTRAQFGTILSRLLRWSKFDSLWEFRYKAHLTALQKQWIMKKIDNPTMKELRWRVMLMLNRIAVWE